MMKDKKTYLIAFVTTVINSYDYALFGFMAARLSQEFFPGDKEIDTLIKYFIIYSSTLIVRPFASLFFGIIGDKYGRVVVLRIGTIGIAIPIFVISIIPPYSLWGYISTLIFIICRILVITFLSGEADGIRIYIYEKLIGRKKYFGSGLLTGCSQAGSLIAAFAAWLSDLDYVPGYIWRLSFFIGGVLGLAVLYSRHLFQETEEFIEYKKVRKFQSDINISFTTVIKINIGDFLNAVCYSLKAFIRSILIQGAIGGIYHFHIIFYSIYTTTILKLPEDDYIKFIRLITIFAYMFSATLSGFLHNIFKPRNVASCALSLSIILSLLNMKNINNLEFNPWYMIMIGALTPVYTTALFVFLKNQFSTGTKYRLFAFSHSLGSIFISSTTPVIAIKIWEWSNIRYFPIIYLVILMIFLLYQLQNKSFAQEE